MREKYEEMSLAQLKDIAKEKGLKKVSAIRKGELIDLLVELEEAEEKKTQQPPVTKKHAIGLPKGFFRPKTENGKKEQKPNVTQEKTDMAKKPAAKTAAVHPNMTASPQAAVPQVAMVVTQAGGETSDNSESTLSAEQREKYEKALIGTTNESYTVEDLAKLDSGDTVKGILEVMGDGFGFIRCENFLPGEQDTYVHPATIRKFGLKSGDIIFGGKKVKAPQEKFQALLYINTVNGFSIPEILKRVPFEKLTPIFPNERIHLEIPGSSPAMRMVDLISPIGKGQRGMIVSPPKAGKTTLLKAVAKSILKNNPDMHLMILLIDERPEEVTDIKEAIYGPEVEIIYSTFDELPEHHKRVSEMVIERAKRLVEQKRDVTILLDSITRLARAYNLTVPPSGRTLSGGLDPAALHMPKRFFGAARNMREGGSLTILATALIDTGSKMDDVVYEEFKGTGNMELVLDRKLSERRVFPAVDIVKSGTRREDLLLSPDELEAVNIMRKGLNGMKSDEAVENIINLFARTRTNAELVAAIRQKRFI
ncbi:MAG: transcription termination factor Rho [Lachnospiraceae bacterium]|nr:transcription termination factor Rho [Lachnospiraceae bacterium]